MAHAGTQFAAGALVRVGTFRLPVDQPELQSELRRVAESSGPRSRWIGRRLLDDASGTEVAIVSVWESLDEMEQEKLGTHQLLSAELRIAVNGMVTEIYPCPAYGAWKREENPRLLRILRGHLVEGDPASLDAGTATRYLAGFEANPSCSAIAAGLLPTGHAVVATLWTSWDALLTETGGDFAPAQPVFMPGWSLSGTAAHYELVASNRRQP